MSKFGNTRTIDRLVQDGWRMVVTHGNGPHVGFPCCAPQAALQLALAPPWPASSA
jgi:carbamate kinase